MAKPTRQSPRTRGYGPGLARGICVPAPEKPAESRDVSEGEGTPGSCFEPLHPEVTGFSLTGP